MGGGSGAPTGDGEPPWRTGSPGDAEPATSRATRVPGLGKIAAYLRGGSESLGDLLATHLGIDARALAAFRISLGAILLANLLLRARYLTAFHTDAGILPRSLLAEVYPQAATYSVFAQFGGTAAQAGLFVIAGSAAVALLVGYRSSLAALASVVLLVSLNVRNPAVLTGGDFLLAHLLFWALLLPIGERWSLDARRRERAPRDRIASLATAGLLLQVVVVYTVNAIHKHGGSTWGEGLGMQYVFHLDQMTVLLGDALATVTPVLVALDYAWYWLVTFSVLLVVLRGWPRAAVASLFVGAHASMLLTMHIGIFAPVSIAALLVFYPPGVWDRLERSLARPLSAALGGRAHALATRRLTPRMPRPAWSGTIVGGWRSIVVPLVAALAISSVVVGNAALLQAGENDRWRMFAPDPMQEAVWVTMGGTTASGAHVDAFPFRETNVTADRPPDMADTYPTVRWARYYLAISQRDDRLQTSLADYVCQRWNATHEDPLLNVTVIQHVEHVRLDGPNPRGRHTVVDYDCTTDSRVRAGLAVGS